jgi:hypothetical protein
MNIGVPVHLRSTLPVQLVDVAFITGIGDAAMKGVSLLHDIAHSPQAEVSKILEPALLKMKKRHFGKCDLIGRYLWKGRIRKKYSRDIHHRKTRREETGADRRITDPSDHPISLPSVRQLEVLLHASGLKKDVPVSLLLSEGVDSCDDAASPTG